ncbi:hypothetical protein NW752_011082 [Fusarium irregulare]|uniref:Uncharacterized protein n=1 Tax=Fusarium irregulare TaxID=2494466 RepID=A0A9W8PFL1_9HYPO|nr:hypothetical protein NW766_012109 [Fusarium irregulare]KAJ4005754.1 hypothetical protein NW752_011082 [Fusarium irregulare]
MPTSCVDLEQTTAALEWQWEGSARFLAVPDPSNTAIRFTIRLDTETGNRAVFEVMVPIKFKDQGSASAIYLRISPLFISSFDFSTQTNPSDALKKTFNCSTTCLNFQLDKPIAVLVPKYVTEPVTAARVRSGKILDSLRELSQVKALRIYIRDALLSLDQLVFIRDCISQRKLEPFSGPDYDISRMYSGGGAKATALAPPVPPSYEKAASLAPPVPPPYERKRSRQDSDPPPNNLSVIWNKLRKLESMMAGAQEPTEIEKPQLELPDQVEKAPPMHQADLTENLNAENAQLRDQVMRLENKMLALQEKYESLEKKHERLEKEHESLERDMLVLQETQNNANEQEDTTIIAMQDDIKALGDRTDYIERGKDDEDFAKKIKEDIFHELAARVACG